MGQAFLPAEFDFPFGPNNGKTPRLRITRRRLPHWQLEGSTYFVTFRLLKGQLSRPERQIVLNHLKSGDPNFYTLIAAVVMPDHVHIVLSPQKGITLSRIMKGIKGVAARKLNQSRGTRGAIWQDESWDRIIRDEDELEEKINYMLYNPVKAGLIEDSEKYDGWYLNRAALWGDSADRNVCPT